ncbi:MAG: hypothetical protein A2066_21655 [Bacteroidetes bacterium GWB2_41_8]|nr:MAG: hypothetical protein A2066_21655 [Bacteroidetes bacterium GWB2_41_8]
MKRVYYALIFSLLALVCSSQVKVVELTHYLFPEFTSGVVLMKSGEKNEALLNYNSLTEEMIFDNRGVKLAIGQLELVDTVYIGSRKFFLLNNKFVELIYKSKSELYAEYKCTVKDPGKPAAYGGTSQTSATTTYSSYFTGGQVYDLKLPEGYETKPFTHFWLKKDGKINKFLTVRQLAKLYAEKENLLKAYQKTNDVKYDDQESILGLIRFLDSNH